jgi:membrane protein DedA with SNARE-associated domain
MLEWIHGLALSISQSLMEGNLLVLGALFLITTVIEFGIQVPWVQDTVLLMVGYQPLSRLFALAPVVIASLTLGRIFGASILYWIARSRGPRLTTWLDKKFRGIMVRVHRIDASFGKNRWLAVALGRFTPGLLIPTSLASGLLHVKYSHFIIGIIISSVIPDVGEIIYGLAVKTGFNILGITPSPTIFIISLVLLMVFIWLGNWLWRKETARRRRSSGHISAVKSSP